MKFKNALLVVNDMGRTVDFYKTVLGLHVIMDFGSNITMTGGICFQTRESFAEFINAPEEEISFGGKNAEIYFEEDNFDGFIEKLKGMEEISYVHPVAEAPWGQRAVRFYDPDRHIVEVGENIKAVCRRFLESEMTVEETAKRMDVPVKFVNACKR